MAEYDITSPDGRTFTVTAPENASEADVLAYAKANVPLPEAAQPKEPPTMGQVVGQAAVKGAASVPDAILNTPQNLYNVGKMLYGLGAGMIGRPDITADIELTKPFSHVKTGLEAVGAISPEKEPQTPAQRVVSAAIQTAANMLVMPASGVKALAQNVAVGAASGAAAETTRELTGSDLLALAVGIATPVALGVKLTSPTAINPTKKATLKEAQAAGYVVQPSTVKSSAIMDKVESVGGKAAVGQEAALRNQEVTNKLAAKALGLADDTTLTPSVLDEVKKHAAKPYEEIEALRASKTDLPWFPRYHSVSLLDELKQARQDTVSLWRSYWARPDEGVKKSAEAAGDLAKSLEDDIDAIAKASGKPELIEQLHASRQLYARVNDVEKALNIADGTVSAPILGRMLDQGKPLSGELAKIGRFALAFPRMAKESATVQPPGVSALEAGTSAAMGIGGVAATGTPAGAILAGAPLVRGPARSLALSKRVQKGLLNEPAPPPSAATIERRTALAGGSLAQQQLTGSQE